MVNSSCPAAQPIRQGNAPGTAPTNTDTALTFFRGVYMKAYTNQLNAAITADKPLKKYQRMNTPASPAMTANAHPSAVLILPDATGRFAVRFIMASVSFSTT